MQPAQRSATAPELEALLRARLDAATTPSQKGIWLRALRTLGITADTTAWLRALWQRDIAVPGLNLGESDETALAACADLGGLAPFEDVSEYLSLVAETTTRFALDLAHRDLPADASGAGFAVIGMGKIAGREFTYHSDLDLIFLFDGGAEQIARASRLGQRLISYLTTMTGAGIAYAVDTRLRPSGRRHRNAAERPRG